MKRLLRWGFSLVLVTSLVGCAHRSARYCGPYRSHCEGLFDVLCHHHANDWGKCRKHWKHGRRGSCSPCGPTCGPTCPPGCQPSFPGVPAYPLPTYGAPQGYAPPSYAPPEYDPSGYAPPAEYPAQPGATPYAPTPAEQPVPEPMDTSMMPPQAPGQYDPYNDPYMATGALNPSEYPQMQHQPYPAYDAGAYPSQGCQNCDLQSSWPSAPVQMSPPVSTDMPVPAPPADLQGSAPIPAAPAPSTSYWRPTAQPQNIAPMQDASAYQQQGIYRR